MNIEFESSTLKKGRVEYLSFWVLDPALSLSSPQFWSFIININLKGIKSHTCLSTFWCKWRQNSWLNGNSLWTLQSHNSKKAITVNYKVESSFYGCCHFLLCFLGVSLGTVRALLWIIKHLEHKIKTNNVNKLRNAGKL